MIAAVRARFLPRFIESARGRIARARALLAADQTGDLAGFASEMHALAGEAAILEFTEIAKPAREGEAGGRGADRETCLRALAEVEAALESIVP